MNKIDGTTRHWQLTVILSFVVCSLSFTNIAAQTLTGHVFDEQTGDTIPFASCIYQGHGVAVASSLDGFFNYQLPLPVVRTNERLLINSHQQDIHLTSLPLNRPILLQDIFSQGTDIQLSPNAINTLRPIINFLRDNPQIKATLNVYCDKTDDEQFNNILIEHRINTLHKHLHTYLPSDGQFFIQNGNNTEQIESSDSGADFIFITFHK